jgi:glycosyltransferase involved in cell wall biosynthesis
VEIWCPERLDDHFLPFGDLAPEHVVPLNSNRIDNPLVEMIDVARGRRSDVAVMDQHCRQSAEQIMAGNFDVLFANSSRQFAVTAIGRFTDIPRVLYLQEPLRELYEATPDLPWATPDPSQRDDAAQPHRHRGFLRQMLRVRKLGILVREEQKNARAYDRILVNSYFSRESVLRAYGLEASVCYLGVDPSRFKDFGLSRQQFVIGVSSVYPAKAIERAIEAIAALPNNRPPLRWIGNVCDDDYRQSIEELAVRRGVNLEIKIDVPDTELIEDLNRASVMLYTPRLEPFGYAPLEAAACGLPVVGVREGGVRETVKHGVTGFLADSSPRALAARVDEVLSNPDLRRRLGSNGRRWVVENWNSRHMTTRLEDHLMEAAHQLSQELRP